MSDDERDIDIESDVCIDIHTKQDIFFYVVFSWISREKTTQNNVMHVF